MLYRLVCGIVVYFYSIRVVVRGAGVASSASHCAAVCRFYQKRRAETLTRARRWGGFLPISPFLTGRPWMLWRRFRLDWRGEGWSVNAANLSFLVMYIRAVLYNQRLLLFPKIPGPNIQMRNKNHALTNKLKKSK